MDHRRLDPIARYREYAEFQFAIDGEGIGLREARDSLASEITDLVRDLDVLVIEAVRELEYVNPALLDDESAKPLAAWWWHLGKIRRGEYPAALLPPHLRALYPALPQAA